MSRDETVADYAKLSHLPVALFSLSSTFLFVHCIHLLCTCHKLRLCGMVGRDCFCIPCLYSIPHCVQPMTGASKHYCNTNNSSSHLENYIWEEALFSAAVSPGTVWKNTWITNSFCKGWAHLLDRERESGKHQSNPFSITKRGLWIKEMCLITWQGYFFKICCSLLYLYACYKTFSK